MEIKPDFMADEFKTASPELIVTVSLAFREGAPFKDDVLAELDAG